MIASFRPRLRVILIVVNLLIILLPLGGIAVMRLYETLVIRETEASLITQGAFVGAAHLSNLQTHLGDDFSEYGSLAEARFLPKNPKLQPVIARLNRAEDEIRPSATDPRIAPRQADPRVQEAGAALSPILRRAQWISLSGVRVVDPAGVVVASTRGELGLSLLHREEVRRALQGEHVSLMRERISDGPRPPMSSISRGTLVRVFVAVPMVEQGRVVGAVILSRTPMDTGKALYGFRWQVVLGALAVMALSLAVSTMTSRVIVRPVRELIHQAEAVTRGEARALEELEKPGTREVGHLSEVLASMARTLQDRAEYIHSFAADVSHEFKTPLASIKGTVEILKDYLGDMSEEERDRFLSNLEADAARLEMLVNRLLELARADVMKPGADLSSLVEALEEIKRRSPGVEVVYFEDLGSVQMSGDVLVSILGNLVDNAFYHGGDGVQVRVEAEKVEGGVRVSVCDNGPGISEANVGKIFERFFTTARNQGGSGLGLAIVRTLLERHGSEIEVQSRPGDTRFVVVLPQPGL